jgi:general secretion pathway protein N
MIRYGAMLGLAAALITSGDVKGQALLATSPVIVDTRESGPAPGTLGAMPALVERATPPAKALPPTGNPLWAVPLKSLSVTRERPIFSASRRPPAPPVLAAAYSVPAPPPSKPAEPNQPLLSLVGTVVGGSEGIGIFLDQATKAVVRLRTGQDHAGWILRSVRGREATFDKGQRTATLALPAPTEGLGAQGPITTGPVASGPWMDGDGQMIGAPQPVARAPATVPGNSQGDGL